MHVLFTAPLSGQRAKSVSLGRQLIEPDICLSLISGCNRNACLADCFLVLNF